MGIMGMRIMPPMADIIVSQGTSTATSVATCSAKSTQAHVGQRSSRRFSILVLLIALVGCMPGGGRTLREHAPIDMHSFIVVDDPNVLYFGSHEGLLKSDDAGKSWTAVAGMRADAMGHAALGRFRIVTGHDVYYISDDGGRRWRSEQPALPGMDIHAVAAQPDERALFAFVVDHGLFRSDSRASTWALLSSTIPPSTFALAVTLDGPRLRILAGGQEGAFVSDNSGASWSRLSGLGPTPSFAVVAGAPRILYAVSLGELHRSEDASRTWSAVPDSPDGSFLVATSNDGARVYVITSAKEVWRSDDAGRTWRRADG